MINPLLNPWHPGQLVCFSGMDGRTDHACGLVGRTSAGRVLRVELPALLELQLDTQGEAALVHDVIYSGLTVAVVLDAHHLLVDGPCRTTGPTPPEFMILRRGERTLIGVASHWHPEAIGTDVGALGADRLDWLKCLQIPDGDRSDATYRKAADMMRGQVYSPEGRFKTRWSTPDRWPHRDLWLWDSAFHAIGWRHLNPRVARELLDAVIATQREDGFIPHQSNPAMISGVTQPPVLALAAGLIDEADPDDAWLAKVYPAIQRQLEWNLEQRDHDGGGLCEWAVDDTNPNNRCDESGMDNSPRFDTAILLDAVDFNSYLAHECEWMAVFADRLGRTDGAVRWRERHGRLVALINARLWDEESGFYFDREVAADSGHPGIWAATGFLPLLCGAADSEQVDRLIRHLAPGGKFDTAVPVASTPPGEPGYTRDMWRGPVWINMNWFIVRGLERAGRPELAAELRRRTCAEIERWHASHGTIFEFYDTEGRTPPPELPRKGRNDPSKPFHQAIHDYGWSATLYVDFCNDAVGAAHAFLGGYPRSSARGSGYSLRDAGGVPC